MSSGVEAALVGLVGNRGVAIWTRNAELKRMFFTNKRYAGIAWSRNSKHFALLYEDLSLQVFKIQ